MLQFDNSKKTKSPKVDSSECLERMSTSRPICVEDWEVTATRILTQPVNLDSISIVKKTRESLLRSED